MKGRNAAGIGTYPIGKVLQVATAEALERLVETHIIQEWKQRDRELLADFLFIDGNWNLWEVECKNWRRYDKPTNSIANFDKQLREPPERVILLASYPFNFTQEVSEFVRARYGHIITVGHQVTPETRGIDGYWICNKFGLELEKAGVKRHDTEWLTR